MYQILINLVPVRPSVSISLLQLDIDSINIFKYHFKYVLCLTGFYDWMIRDGLIVGINCFPTSESDIAEFAKMNLPYVFSEAGEVTIWFTSIQSGEVLGVQDFNAHLVTTDVGETMLIASLWGVDYSIIENTSRHLCHSIPAKQ